MTGQGDGSYHPGSRNVDEMTSRFLHGTGCQWSYPTIAFWASPYGTGT